MVSLFTLVAVLGVLLVISPPSVFPDPANGFQVMRCMELGGKFNRMITPDQDDFSKNTSEFLTWWSPGQYLIPFPNYKGWYGSMLSDKYVMYEAK